MPDNSKIKFCVILFFVGFFLNLIWEISQMQYFADRPGENFIEALYYCTLASVIDGITVISIYFIANLLLSSSNRLFYLVTALLGAMCAVIFEKIAFYFNLWSYKESMPVVPLLEIGIIPFIQLILLVPLSIFLANRIFHKN